MKLKFTIAFFLLATFKVYSADHYSLEVRARSAPTVANVQATANYDYLLWGDKSQDKPLYGYLRLGARGGGSPTYAGFFQISPIAPIIFEFQKGITHRFLKISGFSCSEIECKGRVERTDISMRVLGGVKNFVILGNLLWREISTDTSTKLIGLEYEFFEVTPGFHRYNEASWTLGYKLESGNLVGATYTRAEISEGNRNSSSLYAVYRFPYREFNFVAGIGSYKSDQNQLDQASAIISATYQWGERLSLY